MLARLAGVLLLLLGMLPIANWIPGGHAAPWYGDRMGMWTSGGAILLGVAVIAGIVIRRRPELWRDGLWRSVAERWQRGGWRADIGVAVVALVSYLAVSHLVFSAKPLLIDEIIQVYQARIFASGRLWVPTPEHPEFTSAMHLVDFDGRRFGQFPAGGPAMLMLGTLVGAEWLVGPLFAALAVLLFARLLRRIEPGPGTALAALLLLAFCPFWLFQAGSMMNHVTATAWLMVAALALARAVADDHGQWPAALVAGLALGVAATIRPMDALAFALPTALWLLWRTRLGRAHVHALLASGIGVVLPIAALLWVNNAQTGDPLLFGYELLWGDNVGIGFHAVPWGEPHTPLRGLELVNLYLLSLQTYLLETPAPALLFATAALLLVRWLTAFDRWILAGSGLLLLSYWAYWHDGFYLGPRFFLPLAPWLVLWTVRLPAVLADRAVPVWWRGGVVTAGVVALLMGGGLLLPIRAREHGERLYYMRTDATGALVSAGVEAGATVLVRESWGSQVITRMWALGLSRVETELMYRTIDICRLDGLIDAAERSRRPLEELRAELRSAQADSMGLTFLAMSWDASPRFDPRATYRPTCLERITEDRAGFSNMVPWLLNQNPRVQFVRDLHSLNAYLGVDGSVYLLTQPPQLGGAYVVTAIDPDSVRRSWRADAGEPDVAP